jgi:hypothetical protein
MRNDKVYYQFLAMFGPLLALFGPADIRIMRDFLVSGYFPGSSERVAPLEFLEETRAFEGRDVLAPQLGGRLQWASSVSPGPGSGGIDPVMVISIMISLAGTLKGQVLAPNAYPSMKRNNLADLEIESLDATWGDTIAKVIRDASVCLIEKIFDGAWQKVFQTNSASVTEYNGSFNADGDPRTSPALIESVANDFSPYMDWYIRNVK